MTQRLMTVAQKKKKKNPKQGHPARAQQAVKGVSATQAAMERALDQVTPQFLRWYETIYGDTDLAMPCLHIMRNLFTVTVNFEGLNTVTNFDPQRFAEVFETVVRFEEESQDPFGERDAVEFVKDAVATYVEFLEQTNAWDGTPEDLNLLRTFVDRVFEDEDLELEDSAALSSMEALAVGNLNEMKVVELGRELLRWIGSGRAIEPGGELSAAEAREAISLFGSRLEHQISSGDDLLLRLYLGLALAEVIEIEKDQVRPSAGAEDFLSEDPTVAFGSLFSFVHAFLEESVGSPDSEDPGIVETWELVVESLLRAAEGDPLAVGAPAPSGISVATWDAVIANLAELAELGLIDRGTHYDVPLAVGALLEGMFSEDADELDAELDWDSDPDLFSSPVPDSATDIEESNIVPFPAAGVSDAGDILQLKLNLKYSKPPIWRRILVPGTMTLEQLHRVIQVAFDWNDAHLHTFQLTQPQAKALPHRGDDIDESLVAVGTLLADAKGKFGYLYDFGDNWELEISLEKVLEEDTGELPRCTGGRRTAPLEDSGGIPGWETMLAASNDPAHEMYRDYRDWLGLAEGQDFDGATFDQPRINRRLARL